MHSPQIARWLLVAASLVLQPAAGMAFSSTSSEVALSRNHVIVDFNTRSATAGCGKTHWFNGLTHFHSLASSGRNRRYSIQLPGDYDKDKVYPVVLGFHGSDSIGTWFELDTKMSEDRFSHGVRYIPAFCASSCHQ